MKFLSSAVRAWHAGWAVTSAQPRLVGTTTLFYLLLAFPWASAWVKFQPAESLAGTLGPWGLRALSLLQFLVLAPLVYAICSQLLTAERRDHGYRRAPVWRNPGFLGIFLCFGVMAVLIDAVGAALDEGPIHDRIHSEGLSLAGHWILLACWIYYGTKLWLLLPASATKAPGLGIRNAMQDAEGHFWELFLGWMAASLPIWLPSYLAMGVGMFDPAHAAIAQLAGRLIWVIGIVPMTLVGTAVFADGYQRFGRRLLG